MYSYRKLVVATMLVVLSLYVTQIFAALAITYPANNQQIYIGTDFNSSGTGGTYYAMGGPPVVVKCYKNQSDYINNATPACSSSATVQSNGGWSTATMGYNGAASNNGVLAASQQGNGSAVTITIDWETAP
jgi:hypothetical protein